MQVICVASNLNWLCSSGTPSRSWPGLRQSARCSVSRPSASLRRLQARLAAARADAESGRTALKRAELALAGGSRAAVPGHPAGGAHARRHRGWQWASSGVLLRRQPSRARSCDTEAGPSKVAGECTGVPQLPSLGEAQCGEDPQSSDAPRLADRQNPHTVMPAQVENIAQSSGHMLEAAGLEHQAASAAAPCSRPGAQCRGCAAGREHRRLRSCRPRWHTALPRTKPPWRA